MWQPVLTSSPGNLGTQQSWKPCFVHSVPFLQCVIQHSLKKRIPGAGKLALWIRHLLCKCEDLSSNPQTHIKLEEMVHIRSPCAPKVGWGVEAGEPSEAHKPACPAMQ